MRKIAASAAAFVALCTGCASVTQGTTNSLRIETATATGEQIDGAACTLTNDQGSTIATSGTSTQVRRSSKDLDIVCAVKGQPDAQGRLISRANVGMAGNILLGGGIGAVIDHNTGAAYSYPSWVRLVFGQFAEFDRRDERDGVAMMASNTTLVQGNAFAATAQVGTTAPELPEPTTGQTHVKPGAMLAKGDKFDYRVTDRAGRREFTVVLQAERVENNEVSFNQGARVERTNGGAVRMSSSLIGELDQVTPPEGWMPGGRVPTGSWKMKHRSIVAGSALSYDLDAHFEGELQMQIAGQRMRTLRVGLSGWVESYAGVIPVRARYEGTVWLSPDLKRPVRFEAKSRSSANVGGAFFEINEVAELIRIGRD